MEKVGIWPKLFSFCYSIFVSFPHLTENMNSSGTKTKKWSGRNEICPSRLHPYHTRNLCLVGRTASSCRLLVFATLVPNCRATYYNEHINLIYIFCVLFLSWNVKVEVVSNVVWVVTARGNSKPRVVNNKNSFSLDSNYNITL